MAFRLSKYATLISPARFLFNVGDTSKDWNYKMLNANTLRLLGTSLILRMYLQLWK